MSCITVEAKANMPKKPQNSYMQFRREVYDQVKAKIGTSDIKEMSAAISQMWNELSNEKKNKYTQMHKKEQENYKDKYQDWLKKYKLNEVAVKKELAGKVVEPRSSGRKNSEKAVSEKSTKTTKPETKKDIKQKKNEDKKITQNKKPIKKVSSSSSSSSDSSESDDE